MIYHRTSDGQWSKRTNVESAKTPMVLAEMPDWALSILSMLDRIENEYTYKSGEVIISLYYEEIVKFDFPFGAIPVIRKAGLYQYEGYTAQQFSCAVEHLIKNRDKVEAEAEHQRSLWEQPDWHIDPRRPGAKVY